MTTTPLMTLLSGQSATVLIRVIETSVLIGIRPTSGWRLGFVLLAV
jgi:hypothetical protein